MHDISVLLALKHVMHAVNKKKKINLHKIQSDLNQKRR
jgi:hypothetical protein